MAKTTPPKTPVGDEGAYGSATGSMREVVRVHNETVKKLEAELIHEGGEAA